MFLPDRTLAEQMKIRYEGSFHGMANSSMVVSFMLRHRDGYQANNRPPRNGSKKCHSSDNSTKDWKDVRYGL
jgi:hypothetical protein